MLCRWFVSLPNSWDPVVISQQSSLWQWDHPAGREVWFPAKSHPFITNTGSFSLASAPSHYLAFWLRVVCSLYTFASCAHFSAVKDTGPDASLAVFNTKTVMLPLNSWICVSRTVANKCINISILKTCGLQFNSYLWKIGWRIKRGWHNLFLLTLCLLCASTSSDQSFWLQGMSWVLIKPWILSPVYEWLRMLGHEGNELHA